MPDPSIHPLARRTFVGGGLGLVLAGCAGSAEKWEVKAVPVRDEGLVELELKDYPELITAGGMVALQPATLRKPVLVQRIEGDAVRVLSLECTHLGCIVRWDNEAQELRCPCHGSRFDDRGTPTKGPAKQGLSLYQSQLEGSVLRFWVKEG
jgi:Rieske Fe-S protein